MKPVPMKFGEYVWHHNQQNISFESTDGYGTGISTEAIALQSLQNMYNSATSAISSNIRKNKAKIKYNTIVYLINSEDAR